jgi:hypothetical protein
MKRVLHPLFNPPRASVIIDLKVAVLESGEHDMRLGGKSHGDVATGLEDLLSDCRDDHLTTLIEIDPTGLVARDVTVDPSLRPFQRDRDSSEDGVRVITSEAF